MYGRSAIWFPLALLALLTALTFWIDRTVQPPQPKMDGSSRHDPDYKVNNFTTTKSDIEGTPRSVLSAVELLHYPDDDSSQMIRPRFTLYSYNKPYTQIQGQRGQVSGNGDDVYFMDHVRVVRAASPTRGEMTVLTEYLHLVPEQELAVTDRPVSILQAPHTTARGTGMEYNKKERTLKLSGRVYVHYEKPKANLHPDNRAQSPQRTQSPPKPSLARAARNPVVARYEVKPAALHPIKKNKTIRSTKSAHHALKHQPKTRRTATRIRRK